MTSCTFVILDSVGSAPVQEGRYEVRVWPRKLIPAVPSLQTEWRLVSAETRADIYLLTPFSPHRLVKLRGGTDLEVKRQHADHDGLQYWTVPTRLTFPLSHRALDRLAIALAAPRGLTPDAGLSPAHLIAALTTSNPHIKPEFIQKARLLFQRGTCRAEITRASWANQSRLTVALEGKDPDLVSAEVRRLKLHDLPNLSYGDVLSPTPIALGQLRI